MIVPDTIRKMLGKKEYWIGIGVAVICTVLLIYLTPLKHLNIIEPLPHDIDATEFYNDFQKSPDKYLFIDVRGAAIYDTAHAKGSINMPIGSFYDGHFTLPKWGKTIVLICSSGRLAGVAYGYLQNAGFLNLRRVKGGVQQWALENLPLEGSNILAPIPTVD